MRNNEAGFGASADDEVTKITIVRFDIALPRSKSEAFLEQRPKWKTCAKCYLRACKFRDVTYVIIPFALFWSGAPGSDGTLDEMRK
jgi:hypothetical protein